MSLMLKWKHEKIVNQISLLLLGLIIVLFSIKATYRGGINWAFDFHVYHLPLALHRYGITTFSLSNLFTKTHAYLYSFLPPLTQIVEGFLVKISGQFVAASLLGTLGLLIFNLTLLLYIRPIQILVLNIFFLATPVFIINLPSGLNDIWTNLFLCLSAISLCELTRSIITKTFIKKRDVFIFCISFAIAYYSKLQSWISIFYFVTIIFLLLLYSIYNKNSLTQKKTLFFILLFFLVIFLSWPIRNHFVIGNFFMPFIRGVEHEGSDPREFLSLIRDFRFQEAFIFLQKSVDSTFKTLFTPEQIINKPQFIKYFISYFELNRLFTDEPFIRTSSQWHETAKSLHQMMGGLNGLLAASSVFLLMVGFFYGLIDWVGIVILIGLAGIISVQSQSHEMRYWLVVPFLSYYLICSVPINSSKKVIKFNILSIIVAVMFFISMLFTKTNLGYSHITLEEALLNRQPDIEKFWNTHSPNTPNNQYCIPDYYTKPWLTEVLYLYFNGPTLNNFYVKDCR